MTVDPTLPSILQAVESLNAELAKLSPEERERTLAQALAEIPESTREAFKIIAAGFGLQIEKPKGGRHG